MTRPSKIKKPIIVNFQRGSTSYTPSVKKGRAEVIKIQFTEEQKENIKRILEGKQRADAKMKQHTFNTSRGYQINKIRKIAGGFCCRCGKFNTHILRYKIDGASIIERFCDLHVPKV